MKQDLGTYHVRVELEDGRGWIDRWNTAARFSKGTEHCAPLEAIRLAPVFESEEHLIHTILFNFFDGNGSCDCNKKLALAAAYDLGDAWDEECGDTMPIAKLTLIRPDGSEKLIYPEP